jgi:hypothetical protein
MKADSQGIISDGLGRLGRGKAYRAERTRLLAEARLRRADELERASFWQSIRITWEIERGVRAELARKFPRWALYAARERF